MECVVRDKVMDHFIKSKLFTNKHFGFSKGRSTVAATSHFRRLHRNIGIGW